METRFRQVPRLIEYWAKDPNTKRLAILNAASITEADAWDYLEAILETKRGYGGSVPLWVAMALQAARGRGETSSEIAKRLKTTSSRVLRWWGEEIFDPFTGGLLPVY